ncbi:mycofactocin system FadH/OYE family oxidoreductase 1 [Streptomyces yangpuensis]|uniref:mycofactocin system FadH/OYE family oxidoreductase 1 n=1 Tax=Streptomyces yangpuensis TaxID=1648182 RepID=UPI0035E11274
MNLTTPVTLGGRTAPSRVVFGPHETNLADRRAMSDRHAAYYRERAAGGAGVIVTETASVHPSDWPYERAPLAAHCGPGWAATVAACAPHGTLVLASLGHAGSQGSSAHSQSALWAPSRVADVASRELPMELEETELAQLVDGFADAAALATRSGLDGVEIEAGQYSLLRQFLSGLTNLRTDAYGTDRLRLPRQVLGAVRAALGEGRVLGLRLSCDELAPWAGITPEQAVEHVRALAPLLDYLVVVRGSAMGTSATRPDFHTPPGFNTELCRTVRAAAEGTLPVVLQGSVTDPGQAGAALADGVCDLVEMTRAQIAEPALVNLVRAGTPERIRPCVLCNQKCRVRDNRNPVVSCAVEPRSGHETEDPDPAAPRPAADPLDVLVVGGGPAGLEAARVLAGRGHRVELAERTPRLGGTLRMSGARWQPVTDWLEAEVRRLGVTVRTGTEVTQDELRGRRALLATGSLPGPRPYAHEGGEVVEAADLLAGRAAPLPDGPVLVHDPLGDATGTAVAEHLAAEGRETAIVTQDQVVGTQLALTGDLADANTRLQRAGVRLVKRSLLRAVHSGGALVEDVLTGAETKIPCAAVVHCGHRLPDQTLTGPFAAGDRVAPRTVHEAVLEGRRAALALEVLEAVGERREGAETR